MTAVGIALLVSVTAAAGTPPPQEVAVRTGIDDTLGARATGPAADAPPPDELAVRKSIADTLAAWATAPAADVRGPGRMSGEDLARLIALVRGYRDSGLDVRVALVDSGPTFSVADFTDRLRWATQCDRDCALLTGTNGGPHVYTRWLTYAAGRRAARKLRDEYKRDPVAALGRLCETLMEERRRRIRHRQRMLAIAAAALLGLFALLCRARARSTRAARSPG